jgi:hypothetical protein
MHLNYFKHECAPLPFQNQVIQNTGGREFISFFWEQSMHSELINALKGIK